jgi:hypothetical protein
MPPVAHSPALSVTPLVAALLLAVACSSQPDAGHPDSNGGDETEGCATVPRAKLFPIIGAFLGPDPGPCTMTVSGTRYFFGYDPNGVLVNQISESGSDETVFNYREAVLSSEVRTQPAGVTTTAYEYLDARIRTITTHPDSSTTGYEYEVDERGYVRKARLLNAVSSPSVPTRYTYEFDGCAIQWRVAYDVNDEVNLNATVKYTYDGQRHLATRTSVTSEERFDYSCW